jgi:mono/diheme cytochrome c family protein
MRPERLLPLILVIAGAAAFFSVYRKKTQPLPIPAQFAEQPGPRLFFEHDCATCHTVSALPGARGTLGPGLDDVGARAERLDPDNQGKTYLRESLLTPGKVVRQNFINAMPSFAGRLDDQELGQLVDWLSTLRGTSGSDSKFRSEGHAAATRSAPR